MSLISQELIEQLKIDVMNQPEDTRPTLTEVAERQIDGVTPKEEEDASKIDVSYLSDTVQGIGYGVTEGLRKK